MSKNDFEHRGAVIRAVGDGTRLKTLTRAVTGDDRPKEFCPLITDRTLLDHAQQRVALLLDAAQTFTVVTRTHEHPITSIRARSATRLPRLIISERQL